MRTPPMRSEFFSLGTILQQAHHERVICAEPTQRGTETWHAAWERVSEVNLCNRTLLAEENNQ